MKRPFDEVELPEPKAVFRFFKEISRIPRPSYQEKAISDYLMQFARERGLEARQDPLYNVIMIKEATPGYEEVPPVILQGHMDMVCEKTADCEKNMETEGLDLVLDGDFLSAEGTTLGADDGIAVAIALALLDDDSLRHPRIEFVCTVSEEVGMDGAAGVDLSMLKGRMLLNLDSEDEGHFLAGCAGGGTVRFSRKYETESLSAVPGGPGENPDGLFGAVLTIDGLTGGHSGQEIHRGRASAHRLLAHALQSITEAVGLRLGAIRGGTKDNAIPRSAEAVLAASGVDFAGMKSMIGELEDEFRLIYRETDPELRLRIEPGDLSGHAFMREDDTRALIHFLLALPDGVQRMSQSMPGMTETSLNLGTLRLEDGELYGESLLRSQVNDALHMLEQQVFCVAEGCGVVPELRSEYPAWEYVKESPLRERLCRIYRELTGKEPVVEVIHAGVECGLLAEKLPGLDAVSMGPDIYDIHTPEERMSVSSVKRTYELVRRFLEESGDSQ